MSKGIRIGELAIDLPKIARRVVKIWLSAEACGKAFSDSLEACKMAGERKFTFIFTSNIEKISKYHDIIFWRILE